MYITNTTISKYYSDFKIITEEMYNALVKAIPEFNNRSKVAFIHKIEWNRGEQVMHICFDYFGDKKPDGRGLKKLVQLSSFYDKGMKLNFYHTFNVKEYCQRPEVKERQRERSKVYKERPEVKEQQRKYQRNYRKRLDAKERQKKYQEEYRQRPEVREHKREYQGKYRQRPEVKERYKEYNREYNKRPKVKEYQKEYSQRPEVRGRKNENKRYRYYLKTHNVTKEEFSIDEWRKINKD